MTAIFNMLWLLCVSVFLITLFSPTVVLYHSLATVTQSSSWLFLFLLPVSLFTGVLLLLLVVSLFYRLLPPTPEGKFTMFSDTGAVLWAINNAPATLVLKWFQSTLFLNDSLRFLVLRALGCNVKTSSWITSNTQLSDCRNIVVGENTLIGEHCSLHPSLQKQRNHLRVANIVIGNNVLLGHECLLGPGTQVEDGTSLEASVKIYGYTSIGAECHLGLHTVVEPGCQIAERVHIGRHCIIKARSRIPSGARVPDCTVVEGLWPQECLTRETSQ